METAGRQRANLPGVHIPLADKGQLRQRIQDVIGARAGRAPSQPGNERLSVCLLCPLKAQVGHHGAHLLPAGFRARLILEQHLGGDLDLLGKMGHYMGRDGWQIRREEAQIAQRTQQQSKA